MSLLLRRGHKGLGTDSDPPPSILALLGPFPHGSKSGEIPLIPWVNMVRIRAATMGELELPRAGEAERGAGWSPRGSAGCWGWGLWWCPLSVGSAAVDLYLRGKWLRISTCKTNSRASFCPNEASFAAGSPCLPGSSQHPEGLLWLCTISGSLQFFCVPGMGLWSGRTGLGFTSFIFPVTVSKLIYLRCAPQQMPSPSYCFS